MARIKIPKRKLPAFSTSKRLTGSGGLLIRTDISTYLPVLMVPVQVLVDDQEVRKMQLLSIEPLLASRHGG
jgi:hypothetical protein